MKEKNKWQHKVNYKKSKEGYADVSYEDTWCLDMTLARIIANHLRAFLAIHTIFFILLTI